MVYLVVELEHFTKIELFGQMEKVYMCVLIQPIKNLIWFRV